ncbi:MAG: TlpA family protein disulfide reductase [Candidatus Dadabacteria bacterium]
MKQFSWNTNKILKKLPSYLFTLLLIVFIISKDAKAFLLQQLVSIGIFNTGLNNKETKADQKEKTSSFSYMDYQGLAYSSNDLKGKVVFINFWATWCPPCLGEMPSLNKLYNNLKDDQNIVFLFINEDDNPSAAEAYLKKKGYTLPVFRRGTFPPGMFSGTLPTTIVLDREGKIVLKHEGIGGYNSNNFIRQLKEL